MNMPAKAAKERETKNPLQKTPARYFADYLILIFLPKIFLPKSEVGRKIFGRKMGMSGTGGLGL